MKVGSIYVGIQGDTKPLEKSLNKAKQLATSGAAKVRSAYDKAMGGASMSEKWDKLKGVFGKVSVAAVAAAGAISALVITSAQEAKELENLARVANMSVKEFRGYAFATEQVGVSMETLSDMSKDVQEKLGDFIATGGGEFADFFENIAPKVGLAATELQNLSGPDVLIAVKKALDDVGVSAEEQIFYMESIASDASLLIPLLKDEGKAFKEAAARADELGVALSDVDHQNLLKAGTATKEMTTAFSGLKNEVAAEFAPIFEDIMIGATELIVGLKDEARALAGTIVNIAESGKGWRAVFDGRLSFFEFATMDAKELDEWLKENSVSVGELETKTTQANASRAQGQSLYTEKVKETAAALAKQAESEKKIFDLHKTEAEKRAQATKEMYEEAGFGAEAHYQEEATALIKKAAQWQKAGAGIYETEQWLYEQLGDLSEDAWAKGEEAAGLAMDSMQSQSATLVDEINAATMTSMDKIAELGLQIDTIDGSHIGITAAMDGSGITSEVDMLIAKFEQLRRASAVTPQVAPQPSNPGTSENSESSAQWRARMEAAAPENDGTNVTVNINQQLSRSDVNTVINEQKRTENRS